MINHDQRPSSRDSNPMFFFVTVALFSVVILGAPATVPLFGRFERAYDAEPIPAHMNPYNLTQFTCTAAFTSAFARKTTNINCFYMVTYVAGVPGPAEWRVRFSPRHTGAWTYSVQLSLAGQQTTRLGKGSFSVANTGASGFVTTSNTVPRERVANRRGFVVGPDLDSFYPAGMNLAGYEYREDNISLAMGDWLSNLSKVGGNYARVWTMDNVFTPANSTLPAPYRLALETLDTLGVYDQKHAYNLDQVFSTAEKLDIRILLCLIDQHSFRRTRRWPLNMFNVANGGFLAEPQDYLTSERAMQLFEQRATYIIARYGYSTSLFAWELWNEVDFIDGYNTEATVQWHIRMARFVKRTDQNGHHPVCTSMALEKGDPEVESLPELDFVITHHYDNATYGGDMAAFISGLCRLKKDWFPEKAHLIGEFGVNPVDMDPHFRYWHNGLWAGIVSRCSATPMSWYWQAIASADSWSVLKGAATFLGKNVVPWNSLEWVSVDGVATVPLERNNMFFGSLRFLGSLGRGADPDVTTSFPRTLVGWVQVLPQSTWKSNFTSLPLVPTGVQIQLIGMDGGTYRTIFYNTVTGEPIPTRTNPDIVCHTGLCNFNVPIEFTGDIAFVMKRYNLPPQ